MISQVLLQICLIAPLGQAPVALAARGSFQSDEQYDRRMALEERIQELESIRQAARGQNQDTSVTDSEISLLQSELAVLKHDDESLRPFIPVIQEFMREVDGYVSGLDPISEMTIGQADQLADFLYRDLGHLSANYRASLDVLMHIRALVESPGMPSDVKDRINARLLKYHQEGGGHSAPEVMAYLGESLYLTSNPKDPSRQAALDLMNNSQQWFGMVGEFRAQQEFLESNQRTQAARATEEHIAAVFGRSDVQANELSKLSGEILKGAAVSRGDSRSLEALLREYRVLLRKPKVKPEIAASIEADLVAMAQLKPVRNNPEWKLWKLWSETGGLLERRGKTLGSFATKERERLRAIKAAHKSAQLKAMTYVSERCS